MKQLNYDDEIKGLQFQIQQTLGQIRLLEQLRDGGFVIGKPEDETEAPPPLTSRRFRDATDPHEISRRPVDAPVPTPASNGTGETVTQQGQE